MILPRIAIVGTGRMGAAMAARLAEAGGEVVVYNRTRDRAAGTGLPVAETARAAAEAAEVVLVSLSDDEAVLATYRELVPGLRAGTVVVETSTIDPETVKSVRPAVEAQGAALLDAPVSGSVPLVQRGELTFMVGGSAGALAGARPVLDVLARQVVHVGGTGAGAVVKLAVNAVVHALNLALAEALVLAELAGVPRATTYEVLAASAVAAPFVHYKRAAFVRPDEAPVTFTLDLVAKDLDLITRLAGRVDAPMEQAEMDLRVVRDAIAAGLGDRDMSAVAEFLRGTENAGASEGR
jgi:3-hydroxyisobutyrate dehydrogenase/2-hydroxy-3-oxopropionate reductase